MNENTPEVKKQYSKKALIIAGIVIAVVMAALTVLLAPVFNEFANPEFQTKIRDWIGGMGFIGWLLVLILQMLQIIVAIVPGGPMQLIAGILYGAWGGLFLCLLGSVLASAIIFAAVRHWGERIVYSIFGKDKIAEFAFLRDTQRVETILFLLFLIPGIPKDLLTYLAGLSKIKMSKFLILTTLARTPAMAASTIVGNSASSGDWMLTVIISVIVAVAALGGVVYRDKIMAFIHRRGKRDAPDGAGGESQKK